MDIVSKEHFTSLYRPIRERALIKRNIIAGWAITGLFLFNLKRVLKDILKPLAELTVPKANKVGSYPQD